MSDVYLWETYDKLGRDALEQRDLNQAAEAFRSAVATAEEIGSQDRLTLSLRNLAATFVDQGRVSDAHQLLSQTLDVARDALGDGHSQTVETKRDLSRVCKDLGYLDRSESFLKDVLEFEIANGTEQDRDSTLTSLAQLAKAQGDHEKAAAYFERVVDLRSKNLKEWQPEIAQALLWLSTSLYSAGRSGQAAEHMETAFQILEKQYAREPGHLAQSLLAGAHLMVESGQLEPALHHQKRALTILSENAPPEDPRLWEARELIAATLAGLGKGDEAIELLEYCLRNRKDLEEHKKGALLKNLGGLYLTLGKHDEARDLYEKASALLEKTLGDEHPAYLGTLEEMIQFYHFTKRPKDALKLALKTIKATENRFGAGHPHTAQSYASTALLAHNAEEWETALELMKAAEKIWQSLRPTPEDVLANCRTNIATCLIKMERFKEAALALDSAEEGAVPSLRPIIASLRQQLPTEKEASGVENQEQSERNEVLEAVELEEDDEFSLPDIEDLVGRPSTEPREFSSDDFELPELDDLLGDHDSPTPEQSAPAPSTPEQDARAQDGESVSGGDAETERNAETDNDPPEPPKKEQLAAPAKPPERPKQNGKPIERRAASRTPLTMNRIFDLSYTKPAQGESEKMKSFLVDLSPGGIRINSQNPLPIEEELVLTLPKDVLGEEITLPAQVVWQKALYGESFLQGLAFQDLTSDQERLVSERLDSDEGSSRARGRQHFRLYRPFPIKLRAEGADDWLTSYATDLSLDGLGTRLEMPLEQGNNLRLRLELEFELPTVEVEAQVAWSREGENGISHGIQFSSMGPVEAKTIKRYIDHCLEFSPDD
jgi:tetratricopeptide (TPR) repeat protein